jgi:thiamine kinase-like enzyme
MASARWPSAVALAWVPGVRSEVPPLRIEPLLGGSVNDSWRVDTAQGRFVLRIDGPAWRRPGVDRNREQQLHEAAAGAGLAPRVLLRSEADGVQVSEYLEGRRWSADDYIQLPQLRRLGERLAQLHALEVPAGVVPFDPVACAHEYLQLARDEPATNPATVKILAAIDASARQVADGTAGHAIVHGDLAHGNVLDGAQLWLLDWEYAQCADPLYDVACALAYYSQARPQAAQFLAAAGLEGPGLAERLGAAIRVYEGLSELWHRVRASPRSP